MMRSTARWYVALGLMSVATMACGATGDIDDELASVDGEEDALEETLDDGDELGTLGSALTLNAPQFVNCSLAERTNISEALEYVTRRLYDPFSVRQWVDCMNNGTLSATETYTEQLLQLLRENKPTQITCGMAGPGNNIYNTAVEDVWHGSTTNQGAIAEFLLHELVHTKGHFRMANGDPTRRGLGHPGPEVRADQAGLFPCVEGCIERQMSAPIQAISCLFDGRANDNGPGVTLVPGNEIPLRTEIAASTGEVTLAPVGNIIDTEGGVENHCSTNLVGVGIRGRYASITTPYGSGTFVTALGMTCRDGAGAVHYNGRTGATSGTTFSVTCPADEILVGVKGRSGWWLDSLEPKCANKQNWADVQHPWLSTTTTPESYGGPGGGVFERWCPFRHAIKGLRLRYDGVFTRTEVVCQKVGQPGNIQTVSLPTIGASGSGALVAEEFCPSKSVMTKLWGVSEVTTKKLLRLGAGCTGVIASPGQTVSLQTGTGSTNHMLPFAGRWLVGETGVPGPGGPLPGTGFGDTGACQTAGSAFVGLKTYTLPGASSVSGVRALCANVEAWSNGNTSSAMAHPVGEDDNTTIQQQMCPARHFLTGWRIGEEPDVTNISLRCRQF
jgi:hypothetical protein